jgi:hypothetical protein
MDNVLDKKEQAVEILKNKVRRHLTDKNDIITEEDIRDTLADKKGTGTDAAEDEKKTE